MVINFLVAVLQGKVGDTPRVFNADERLILNPMDQYEQTSMSIADDFNGNMLRPVPGLKCCCNVSISISREISRHFKKVLIPLIKDCPPELGGI